MFSGFPFSVFFWENTFPSCLVDCGLIIPSQPRFVYIPSGLVLLEDVTKQVWGGSEEVLCFLFMLGFSNAGKSHVSICLPVRKRPCC